MEYGQFARRLNAQALVQRLPLSGSLELTSRCNLACVHCYLKTPVGQLDQELSTQQWFGLLDELAEAGCLWLLITGGEPLSRPDFLDIYLYAKKRGFIITLFTNGTLLTPAVADVLAQWPPGEVEVSIYGHTPEVFDTVTRVPGSYARCHQGIQLLRARGLPVNLKTVALTLNQHELGDMQRFAQDLGLDFRYDAEINAGMDGDLSPCALRLPPESVVQLDRANPERWAELQRLLANYGGAPENPQALYQCGAGTTSFHIDACGRLSICLMARERSYPLAQGGFHQGWHTFLAQEANRQRRRHTPCNHCNLTVLCGQCPGFAYVEHGDPETTVEFLCRIAQLRAAALRTPTGGHHLED